MSGQSHNIVDLIIHDHRTVDTLYDQLKKATVRLDNFVSAFFSKFALLTG
jgi:acetolactate synthase regulatory subunit